MIDKAAQHPDDTSRGSDLLGLLPSPPRRLLHISCGDGRLTERLKRDDDMLVIGLESNRELAEAARNRLDEVVEIDVAALEGFAERSFDTVIWTSGFAQVIEPRRVLANVQRWLKSEGTLAVTIPNVRHHEVICSLLAGSWRAGTCEDSASGARRYYTRREIEKLFYRAGFTVKHITAVPGAGYRPWQDAGKPGSVQAGPLRIEALQPQQAEEFYAAGFHVIAAPAKLPDFGLTSIVIVTHNELGYTRGCLESIRFYTDEPFEFIVVDNGSTDGTVEYLRSCSDVKLIENADNRGFPAAANQGIKAAGGSQVLLLNNDVLVTTGWLRRMFEALHSDSQIGLVGPCTNNISGPQQVPADYQDLALLDGFAWEWAKHNAGNWPQTDRLVGFCLLVRREVVQRIGLLDEQFGIGNFEDDDFCLRARQAGYHLLNARDAFVHHFGSVTFRFTGVDYAALMKENQQRFHQKWQTATSTQQAGQPSPRGATGPQHSTPKLGFKRTQGGGLLLTPNDVNLHDIKLSLCMIVRDNEETIRPCLESIRPWVDEMIVVDTGSQDETPQIARELGARLYHFPWCDDFAAARNESLKYARGEWIFWMDSDDTISEENGRKLRELIERPAAANLLGYVVQVHCPGPGADGDCDITIVDHVKVFRNLPSLRFEGRIHEQILMPIRAAGGEVACSDIYVVHSGADHTPEGRERKLQRDLRLLELDMAERPDHPFVLFNLGMTYADANRYQEAVDVLKRCLRVSDPKESQVRKAYALLVSSHFQLKQYDAAWEACRRGREIYPEDAELLFRKAMLLHEFGRLEEAAASYQRALHNDEQRHFSSLDQGIRGFKTRHNLAVVLTDMGRLEAAEEQWRATVAEMPNYRLGWRGLRDNLVKQGKFTELAQEAQHLLANERLKSEGLLAQADLAKQSGDLAAAREYLEAALEASPPDDLEAQRVLSQFLFEHGPLADAERSLRQLAEACPEDPCTRHNLGTVYLRQQRYEHAVEAYEQSLELRPDAAMSWAYLGNALHRLGRNKEAAQAHEQSLRLEMTNGSNGSVAAPTRLPSGAR